MGVQGNSDESNGTEAVFSGLRSRLESDDVARSLWEKLEQEMGVGGIGSVNSYLRTRFTDLSSRIKSELDRLSGG
jgi:hypothetical protein